MCFRTMAKAVSIECSTAGEKLVLLMLADRTNADSGECYPSHSRLAADCCMSIGSVKNHIKSLEKRGLLKVIRRHQDGVNLPNIYTLNLAGVGQPLTEGRSTIDRGVGQPLPTNLEVEPINKPIPSLTLGDEQPAKQIIKETIDHGMTFDKFWSAYPKRVGKEPARKAWMKIKPNATTLTAILKAIEVHKTTDGWLKDKGQFIPNPSTWLNQKRWEDEIETAISDKPVSYLDSINASNADWLARRNAA